MTRPLRVPLDGLVPGPRVLSGATARYVARVRRVPEGGCLALFDPDRELEALARVESVGKNAVRCQVGEVIRTSYRPHPVLLVQALAKGDKSDRAVAEATALGARGVCFVDVDRTVPRPSEARLVERRKRWRRVAIQAARQCGRGGLPGITGPLPLGELPGMLPEGPRLLMDASGPGLLTACEAWRGGGTLSLLVGPEGGLTDAERARAVSWGFRLASLGATVLRTELAATAALAVAVAFADARGMLEARHVGDPVGDPVRDEARS